MTIKQTFLLALAMAMSVGSLKSQVTCDVHRQQFTILSDNSGTHLGANMLIGEYSGNTSFGSLMTDANMTRLTNTPEYLVLRQINLLSAGDLGNALDDFKPGESRERARKMFANVNGLKNLYANIQDFRLLAKALFGPLTHITYESSSKNGHRVTFSAYLEKYENKYVFVEPKNVDIFACAAASFPYWIPESERQLSKVDDKKLLNATFIYSNDLDTNLDFSNSKIIIKYNLNHVVGNDQVSESRDPLGVFMRQVIDAYKNDNTNGIVSVWRPGIDRMFIKAAIQNGEQKATVDYFRKYKDFNIVFYISNENQYWIYITPSGDSNQLKLFHVVKIDDTFKLNAHSDEVFADEILSSEQMAAALMMQVRK
jgi:hypothetical protein